MDKTRTLPPLVRGRVIGVLGFYVDEIKLYRNILLMTDSFDFVLQVQWWGECLPAVIRPMELKVQDRTFKNCPSLKSYFHLVKYEIKTTLDLFKLYLDACEVIELCVLETVKNYVIGSAFLRNLISILSNNNKFIRLPIFDYLGQEIGEVTVHVNFTEESYESQGEIPKIYENNYLDKYDHQIYTALNKIRPCYLSLAEKTLFYSKSPSEEKLCEEGDTPMFGGSKENKIKNFNLSSLQSEKCKCFKEKNISVSNNENEESLLPEIKAFDDSSKVLCFSLSSKELRQKTNSKNLKPKLANKFCTNSIKYKSKSTKLDSSDSKSDKKPCVSSKHLPVLGKQLVSTTNTLSELKSKDLQSIPSKESSNVKVLDYLLGSDMSKDEEEMALRNFKSMSPSHNLVDSISQLYLKPVKNSQACKNKLLVSPKSNHLNFDLNNPIERNYYKKFFLTSSLCNDFELAEYLNKPENTFAVDKSSEIENFKCNETKSHIKEDMISNKTNNCAHCKYFKKLDELDTIIESLKHFEQKILKHEKDMQLNLKEHQRMLNKRNRLKDS